MADWRPIETAPRDATRILIAMPREEGAVCEAWWATDYEGGPGYWSTPPSGAGRGYTILADYPTHWMPLPDPPK